MVAIAERNPVIVVDSYSMDTGIPESTKELALRYETIQGLNTLKDEGILRYTFREAMQGAERGEIEVLDDMHAMCALLHADWQAADLRKDELHAVAVAKIFNILTKKARDLNPSLSPEHNQAFAELYRGIQENYAMERANGKFNKDDIAAKLFYATHQLRQEDTWAYRLLPARYGQAYTSMGLFAVPGDIAGLPPTYITNITVRNTRMFSHMHGLSMAFSAPNGTPEDFINNNAQTNIVWRFNSKTEAFPPKFVFKDTYDNTNVVNVPPRYLHSIVRPHNVELHTAHSLKEVLADSSLAYTVIQNAKFGLYTNTHIYRPIREMVEQFKETPAEGIWERAGTIALDHDNKYIYAGNLHAMALRMAYWQRGECCGACFQGKNEASASPFYREDDTREPLTLGQVSKLIHTPQSHERITIWTGNPYTGELT